MHDLAKEIIKLVGGKENINSLTHCATRLRFRLVDTKKANGTAIKNLDGVLTVVESGGQYQVVIGEKVAEVYDAIMNELGYLNPLDESQKKKSKNIFGAFLDLASGVFNPTLGVLAAGGIIRGILALVVALGLLDTASGTYVILNATGYAVFYFFPIFLGYSAAKKFKIDPLLGMAIGAALVYPDMVNGTSSDALYQLFTGSLLQSDVQMEFLGIPVILMDYTSTVIPIIAATYFASKLHGWLNKILPTLVKKVFLPCFVLVITVPLALIVIGPISTWACSAVGNAVSFLFEINGVITSALLGFFWQILVMFGLHWGLLPVAMNNLAVNGYDYIFPVASIAAYATGGAVLAVFFLSKKPETKELSLTSFFPVLFSAITEPAIYGVTIPLKKPFMAANIATALGGIILGLFHTKTYFMASDSFFGAPSYIEPDGTFGSGFWGLIIAWIVVMVAAFILTCIFGIKEDEVSVKEQGKKKEKEKTAALQRIQVFAPVKGKVIPLQEIHDEVFASGSMGEGIAILPEDNKICSPVKGTVSFLFPTAHAIGIQSEDGAEILIHIGIDSAELQNIFRACTSVGQEVEQGDVLITFDLDKLKKECKEAVVPVIVTNSKSYLDILKEQQNCVNQDELMFTLVR